MAHSESRIATPRAPARNTRCLRPVLSTEDLVFDQRQRGPMACPKLGFGHAEVPARLGEVETIQIEATNHFTVPGACPKGAVLLLLDDNRAARELGRDRHVAALERVAGAADQLDDVVDVGLDPPTVGRGAI